MKSTFLAFLVMAFASCFAKAENNSNLDLMQEVLGTFPVLSFNGQPGTGGKISIQANMDGVG